MPVQHVPASRCRANPEKCVQFIYCLVCHTSFLLGFCTRALACLAFLSQRWEWPQRLATLLARRVWLRVAPVCGMLSFLATHTTDSVLVTMSVVLGIAVAVIRTRTACNLGPKEVDFVAGQVVTAFTLVAGGTDSNAADIANAVHRVTFRSLCGQPPCGGRVFGGLVFELGFDNTRYVCKGGGKRIPGGGPRTHCTVAVFKESMSGEVASWMADAPNLHVHDATDCLDAMGLRRLRTVYVYRHLLPAQSCLLFCLLFAHPAYFCFFTSPH